jgi:hypothetical protein
MRRRRVAVEDVASDVPVELRRFRLEDWQTAEDAAARPPSWWESDPAFWRLLGARRRHSDAVRAYQLEHGIGFWDWDRARGACSPACQSERNYQHAHG